MTRINVTILIIVILCHVAHRKESKSLVALARMGYVVMISIVVATKVTSVVLMKWEKRLAVVRLIPDPVALLPGIMRVALQTLLFVVVQLLQVIAVP